MKMVELSQHLDSAIMGMVVEDSKKQSSNGQLGKVRVKMLAIKGGQGPDLHMDRSLAETLYKMLGEYLTTGERQER